MWPVTVIVAVVVGILALVIQLLFWSGIADRTVSVDLPEELEIERAGRYYAPAERRYYELVFTRSVSVTVPLTEPLRQMGVLTDSSPISPCLQTSLSGAVPQTYACSLSAITSTIVAEGPRGSRRSAHIWSLQEHWPVTGTDVLSRAVHLTLESQSAQVRYTTWLSPESTALDSLRRAEIPPGLFVKLAFYPDRPQFTGAEFYSVSEALIDIGETRATVTVRGTLSGPKYTPKNVSDVLGLSLPLTDARRLSPILIEVQAKDVAITQFTPFPSAKRDRLVTWRNPPAVPQIDYQRNGPFQTVADSVVRLWEDIEYLRRQASDRLSVPVILLVPLIPIFWLLVLVWRGRYPAEFDWDRARPALVLSGLLWLVPIVSLVLAPLSQGEASPETRRVLRALACWASSLAVAGLAVPIYWRSTVVRRIGVGEPIWLRGLVYALGLCGLIAILALGSNRLFRKAVPLALMGMILLLATAALAWLPGQGEKSVRKTLKSLGPGTWALVVGGAAVLAYPTSSTEPAFYPPDGWPVAVWQDLLFPFGVYLLPYVPLAILLAQMHAHRAQREPVGAQVVQGVGHLLFAFYVVGATRGLGMAGLARNIDSGAASTSLSAIPVAFVLAWIVAYRWLIPAGDQRTSMRNLTDAVYAHRDQLIKYVLDAEWAEKARDKQFDESTDSGQYEAAKEQFQEYLTGRQPACLPKGQAPRECLFACGPRSSDWENAMLGLRRGLVLMVPLFVIYSPPLLAQAIRSVQTAYLPLQLITRYLLPVFVKWIFYSFFLGYFFRYIRGCNGWQKGLSLAVSILFCTLAHDLLVRASTKEDLLALALDAAQTVLFLTILGLWAFDYQTLRDHGYGWRKLLIVHNVAFLGSYVSSVLATLGAVITAAATDKLTSVLTAVLGLVVPEIGAQ